MGINSDWSRLTKCSLYNRVARFDSAWRKYSVSNSLSSQKFPTSYLQVHWQYRTIRLGYCTWEFRRILKSSLDYLIIALMFRAFHLCRENCHVSLFGLANYRRLRFVHCIRILMQNLRRKARSTFPINTHCTRHGSRLCGASIEF